MIEGPSFLIANGDRFFVARAAVKVSTICVLYSHCPVSYLLKTFQIFGLGPRTLSGYAHVILQEFMQCNLNIHNYYRITVLM